MSNSYYLMTIFGCALVTWLPRVLPFVLTKAVTLPKILENFLSYLPMTILTALLLQSILNFQPGHFPTFRLPEVLACIPALIVGIRTNDLMKIVLTGILGIALLRCF
ncbi:AzlD domain-containing protein [Enterococcus pseudoavium]|uniref:AzlD domain-containing protein n=1 Tax=Enterococcus pseudoavium TaxID=44007 RepID=A0AAE4I2S3_9ENTE|nr:AzlD domain-containing protein [Enterococcus pseudoavium]MDT2736691.1 AzlD domain-containing protein [Enterococcus pseudoavium]MDT2753694.1 AzlD domain-containing protein [Enterococcus pseudoavium]MDT2771277.1 AzlD domain-containing protein [Enterococcus pseudoavium]